MRIVLFFLVFLVCALSVSTGQVFSHCLNQQSEHLIYSS